MSNLPFWLPWALLGFGALSFGFMMWYVIWGGEEEEDETEGRGEGIDADTLAILGQRQKLSG